MAIDEGLRVPQDVAIIGCDDGPDAIDAPVAITTVSYSNRLVRRWAIDLIEQIRSGGADGTPAQAEPVIVPVGVVVRDSCGAKLKGWPASKEVAMA